MRYAANISEEVAEVEGEVPDLSGKLADLYGEVPDISGELADLYGEVPDISGELADLYGEVPDISGELAGLYGEVPDISGELADLYGEVPDLTGRSPSTLESFRTSRSLGPRAGGARRLPLERVFGATGSETDHGVIFLSCRSRSTVTKWL